MSNEYYPPLLSVAVLGLLLLAYFMGFSDGKSSVCTSFDGMMTDSSVITDAMESEFGLSNAQEALAACGW